MPGAHAAIVRPRVRSPFSGETVVLEDLVLDLLAEEWTGALRIEGPPGWGLATARTAMDWAFHADGRVTLILRSETREGGRPDGVVLWMLDSEEGAAPEGAMGVPLAAWSLDEGLEYLQERAPEACASVMDRLQGSGDTGLLGGCPALWVLALDRLAADPHLESVADALRAHVESARLSEEEQETLTALWRSQGEKFPYDTRADMSGLPRGFRHVPVLRAWLALQVARVIESGDRELLAQAVAPDKQSLGLIARYMVREEQTLARLRELLEQPSFGTAALAVGLLHVWDPSWLRDHLMARAVADTLPSLVNAQLSGFDGRGLVLPELRVPQADLSRADFRGARLIGLRAYGCRLTRADLSDADLSGARARAATLRGCFLKRACLDDARLPSADLGGAVLDSALMRRVNLEDADLRRASLRGADATSSLFVGARLEEADLTNTCLDEAELRGADLRQTTMTGARLPRARLDEANLSGVDLRGADLREASLQFAGLTGTCLAGANLTEATLTGARMARVNLEGALLCKADLRRVNFHLGSSRSGLIDSPIAGEGSRTGFYTEDDATYDFKRPEEIRKANLRGANLLGALVEDTDFYLVDVRDVLCSDAQREHFRRCRAILE